MSAPNQIIKPFENPDMFDFEHSVQTIAYKINEIIDRLNHLLDVMSCHFESKMCLIHNSPQIYTRSATDIGIVDNPSDYCAVAEAKMRARIETNLNQS